MLSSVDFPQPDGPTRVTNSPRATSRLMPRTASTVLPSAWNTLPTFSKLISDASSAMGRFRADYFFIVASALAAYSLVQPLSVDFLSSGSGVVSFTKFTIRSTISGLSAMVFG